MGKRATAPGARRRGIICAAILLGAATCASASHVGEELLLDQQVLASTNQLLSVLGRYQRAPAVQRATLATQLAQAAAQRRERMLKLIDESPRTAALRVLPRSVVARLPADAQALVEQPVSMKGSISATVSDDFEHGHSHRRLQLNDGAGGRFELRAAQASDREQLGWVGKRGAVTAMRLADRLLVVEKRNVQLLAADGTTTSTSTTGTTTAKVQGDQKTLVIMLNFRDKAIECTAADLRERLFGTTGATLNQGYRQSSGNLVSFSGQVVGPFNIDYSSTGTCDYNGWATAANAAATAAGFSPGSFNRVSYAMPRNTNCNWLGLGALGGPQPSPTWVQQCTATGMFSHELGHNLNFHHAATPTSEYGDASDPMGAAKLVQSNAANRVMAGWIGGSQVQDVSSAGSYAVSALESATPTAPQVLRLLKRDTNEYYYVSLRQPVGVDSNLWSTYQNKISIHKATGTLPAYTFFLASLDAGQSWSDSANGITVTSQGVSGTDALVSVGFGGATCNRQSPTLAIAPAAQDGAPGASLAYTLNLVNNNSSACPTSSFNLAQSLPSGFSASFDATSVSLAPGASANVGWRVASSTSSTDAAYTLTATASESAVANAAEAHATYTVVSPPIAPPPPPPPADTTPPVVGMTSPANGATVSSRTVLTLAASASDNVAVSSVAFYVDGKLVASDSAAPYAASWNPRKASRGQHSLRVRAVDTSGNAAEQTISITVN